MIPISHMLKMSGVATQQSQLVVKQQITCHASVVRTAVIGLLPSICC